MGDSIPACFGSYVDADEGLLLLADVRGAIQGDELVGCTREQAQGVVQTVARLHAHTSGVDPAALSDVEVWRPTTSDAGDWSARIDAAARRYPDLFTAERRRRVLALRGDAEAAAEVLEGEPIVWIHLDPHLDNVLWRPDGSTVLLDWSNARVGPAAVDVAAMLFSLAFGDAAPIEAVDLIGAYAAELVQRSQPRDPAQVTARARLATTQSLVGRVRWASGALDAGSHDRKARLRDDSIRRVFRALDWLDAS